MAPVTDVNLWRRVGQILREKRGDVAFTKIRDDIGLDPKTMQSIEDGSPGNLGKLERYAQHLGLDLVDVLCSLLTKDPLTVQAAEVLRRFGDLSKRQREAFVQILRVTGRDAVEELPTGHRPPVARPKKGPSTS